MNRPRSHVLVTDFDGTILQLDFYQLVRSQLLPPNVHNDWDDDRAGRITHFAALQRYFAAIHADEATVFPTRKRRGSCHPSYDLRALTWPSR